MNYREKIARYVYHKEIIDPRWAILPDAVKKKKIAEIDNFMRARNIFQDSKSKLVKEAYGRHWNKFSESQKEEAFDKVMWFLEAFYKFK